MTGRVLVIDTATPAVTAAVVLVDGTSAMTMLGISVIVDSRAHAERLTPNVVTAVEAAELTMADLDAVVVGCGPGPFTGLRVGMATAAAYGHALEVPVFGVCSLDGIGARTAGEVLVITDARRREVYWARYRDGRRIDGPGVCAAGEVPVGAAEAVAGSQEHCAQFNLPVLGPDYPTPEGLVAAVTDWSADPGPLVPLYLRRPDAKTLAERGQA